MNQKTASYYPIARTSAFLIAIVLLAASAILGRIPVFLLLNKDFGTIVDNLLLGFTYLAEGWIWIPYLLIAGWFFKKDKAIIIYSFVISTLFTQIPKLLLFPNITRPIASGIDVHLIHTVKGVEMHQLSSFPSGHTATAFTLFLLTIYLFDQKKLILIGLIYAMLCGYSRIYLGQHFPMDVGGGIIVAILTIEISKESEKYNPMLQRISFSLIAVLMMLSGFAQDTTQQIINGRKNSAAQMKKPYVIMISIDGMRTDFTELHQAHFLQKISKEGIRAKYMTPSFPSLTFPNHYAIATGQYPSHNGLVDNTYFDKATGVQYSMSNVKLVRNPKYYGGTPIWVLAEKQQMISASYFWVGSEAPIEGYLPSYYYNYNEKTNIATRIQAIKDWLSLPEEKRPHLITLYFPEVDHDAHSYGTKDNRVTKAVQFVDSAINAIQENLRSLNLPINYIVVSDHGMTDVDNENTMGLPKQIDTASFRVPWGDALLHLYAKDSTKISSTVEALKKDTSFNTYTLNETPSYWHYAKKDDRYDRLGDIIITPHLPKVFNLGTRKTTPGKHGFDNHHPDMRATFIAWGPAFKKGLTIDGFENINVYPLVAHILGLELDETKIDGKLKVLAPILKK